MAYAFALCRWRGEGLSQWPERLQVVPVRGTVGELAETLTPWALATLRAHHEDTSGEYRALLVDLDDAGEYHGDFVEYGDLPCTDVLWFYGSQHVPIDLLVS
jgi:hypothetical protein